MGSPNAQNGANPHEQNGSTKVNAHEEVTSNQRKSENSSLEDVDQIRCQEIMGKAVSAILLLLLKWFKLSRMSHDPTDSVHLSISYTDILKFEHLSQLLLDANYLQIVLKQFTHQDIEQVIRHRSERKNFKYARPLLVLRGHP